MSNRHRSAHVHGPTVNYTQSRPHRRLSLPCLTPHSPPHLLRLQSRGRNICVLFHRLKQPASGLDIYLTEACSRICICFLLTAAWTRLDSIMLGIARGVPWHAGARTRLIAIEICLILPRPPARMAHCLLGHRLPYHALSSINISPVVRLCSTYTAFNFTIAIIRRPHPFAAHDHHIHHIHAESCARPLPPRHSLSPFYPRVCIMVRRSRSGGCVGRNAKNNRLHVAEVLKLCLYS